MVKKAVAALSVEVIDAFKGFDKNLRCRDMQYAIGETFNHTGVVQACKGGLHSCESPLDVFNYYPPATSRFATVKASGSISREPGGDSKIASAQLVIEAEISIPTLVTHAISWVMKRIDKSLEQSNTGNRSAASNTGNRSAASNTGYQSAASNTGYQSAASNTGNRSAASNTGDQSAASNTGDQSAASNTGDQSAASNTGYQSAASNTGDQSAASNTGNRSAASNTGYQSAASNTGDQSAAEVSGKQSVAASFGIQGKARASEGGAIVLCYRTEMLGIIKHIRASKVGENGVEADVWYVLNSSGNFVKA